MKAWKLDKFRAVCLAFLKRINLDYSLTIIDQHENLKN